MPWLVFIVVVMKTLKCAGTVPLPGRVMFINIPNKTSPYSLTILLLQTYSQKLVPPLIFSLPISFCKGLKWLNNIWKKKCPKLHLLNALLSKAQSNWAKNTKTCRSLRPTWVTTQSQSICSPTWELTHILNSKLSILCSRLRTLILIVLNMVI